VRWAEVDMQKIVFNGHYLMYFDTAVAGYWRALALPYAGDDGALQGDLYVRKATSSTTASARYDDQLEVGVRCARIGNSSMLLQGAVFRGDRCWSAASWSMSSPTRPPRPASRCRRPARGAAGLRGRCKPMVDVQVGGWDHARPRSERHPQAVFVDEQGIPAEMEWDAADADCVHAVAYNRFGLALATGRLLEHVPGVAKIGRMAVLPAMRGSGVGRQVLDALMKAARARGDRERAAACAVQPAPFYLRAGSCKPNRTS
jgi:YbgC/YbaW family acyl-CoA thioester hydrolase